MAEITVYTYTLAEITILPPQQHSCNASAVVEQSAAQACSSCIASSFRHCVTRFSIKFYARILLIISVSTFYFNITYFKRLLINLKLASFNILLYENNIFVNDYLNV